MSQINTPDNTLLKLILEAIQNGGDGVDQAYVDAGDADSVSSANAYTDERLDSHAVIPFDAGVSSAVEVDFSAQPYRTLTLNGDCDFIGSVNRSAARSVTILIKAPVTLRNFTWPSDWIFVGEAAPASINGGREAVLTVTAFGPNETDVRAAYAVQPEP